MIVLLGISILCGLAGVWLVVDYLYWFFTGQVVPGTIEKFEDGKPVMGFETLAGEDKPGKKVSVRVQKISHMGYYLTRAQAGDVFNTIYTEDAQGEIAARVYGFLHLLLGAFLFLPGLGYFSFRYGQALMASQLSFIVVFAVILLGGWAALKFIRRNY